MRYTVRQKLLTFGDDFKIKDDQGRDLYYVDGKAYTFLDQLYFRDMNGQELARIRQQLFCLRRTYGIYKGSQLAATVKKALISFRPRFFISGLGQNYQIKGKLWWYDYKILKADKLVATVSKRIVSMTDAYSVDIEAGEDDVLILACAIIIDMVLHKQAAK